MKVRYKSCSICLIADLDSAVVAFVCVEIDFLLTVLLTKFSKTNLPCFGEF